ERRETQTKNDGNFSIVDLLRTPKLRKRTIVCTFNWFVNAVVFFGINLYVKNLGGDLYLNFFILCIIEIPGALICWYLLGRFGRRLPYCAFEIIGGVACMLVLAFPTTAEYGPVITTLAMIGKVCVSNNFLAVYVFTVELYPTVIRQVSMLSPCIALRNFTANHSETRRESNPWLQDASPMCCITTTPQ
ncbi:hypothetical protein QZH41_014360, partial [Actinostola sp. cb2023]